MSTEVEREARDDAFTRGYPYEGRDCADKIIAAMGAWRSEPTLREMLRHVIAGQLREVHDRAWRIATQAERRRCAAIGPKVPAAVCREIAEFDDRTSPDYMPDALLVTADELTKLIELEIAEQIERGTEDGT
jgi:hypothetical protein